jgi:leucyl aminopeptidase (aminopeptidase T)
VTYPAWAVNTLDCLAVEHGTRFQALVDEPLTEAGLILCRAAIERGARATVTVIPDAARPLSWASEPFLASLADTDAAVMFKAHIHDGEFAPFRQPIYARIEQTGTRLAFGPDLDDEIFATEMAADYGQMAERCASLIAALGDASSIRVTTPGGTDCTFDVTGRPWIADDGRVQPGHFGNLPAGEVFIAPTRRGAHGVCVIDRSIAVGDLGLLAAPIALHFENGRIVEVSGGKEADIVRAAIAEAGEGADVIAELGIGTNERARITGKIITDEKVLGTAHVAFGDNTGHYGGDNSASIHVDGVMADATIEAGGRIVMERGVLAR